MPNKVFGTDNSEAINLFDGVTNGADQIFGYGGHDTIYGLGGGDSIFGGDGNDDIFGGSSDDMLKGGGGADDLDGGPGTDEASYSDSTEGVVVFLTTGVGTGGTAEGDTLTGIENLTGSGQDDFLVGNDDANVLTGLQGNDTLKGGGGADGLDGYTGDDTLRGGGGADLLNGGSGIDTADYFDSSVGVFVSLIIDSAGNGDAEGDELNSIENVTGSAYADTLVGNDGVNVLRGLDGNDILKGYGGADTLWGGDGNDTYFVDDTFDTVTESGGEGMDEVRTSASWHMTAGADIETLQTIDAADTAAIYLYGNASGNNIIGNNGSNAINGGDGDDELTGLGGADSFRFDTALSEAFNVDVITDFNVADDMIVLDQTIFSSSLGLGNISAGEFVIGAAALDANDRIIYNSATGALFYDSDGGGGTAQIQFATLSTGLALTNLDFLVVA